MSALQPYRLSLTDNMIRKKKAPVIKRAPQRAPYRYGMNTNPSPLEKKREDLRELYNKFLATSVDKFDTQYKANELQRLASTNKAYRLLNTNSFPSYSSDVRQKISEMQLSIEEIEKKKDEVNEALTKHLTNGTNIEVSDAATVNADGYDIQSYYSSVKPGITQNQQPGNIQNQQENKNDEQIGEQQNVNVNEQILEKPNINDATKYSGLYADDVNNSIGVCNDFLLDEAKYYINYIDNQISKLDNKNEEDRKIILELENEKYIYESTIKNLSDENIKKEIVDEFFNSEYKKYYDVLDVEKNEQTNNENLLYKIDMTSRNLADKITLDRIKKDNLIFSMETTGDIMNLNKNREVEGTKYLKNKNVPIFYEKDHEVSFFNNCMIDISKIKEDDLTPENLSNLYKFSLLFYNTMYSKFGKSINIIGKYHYIIFFRSKYYRDLQTEVDKIKLTKDEMKTLVGYDIYEPTETVFFKIYSNYYYMNSNITYIKSKLSGNATGGY